jgi:hypothetical protein
MTRRFSFLQQILSEDVSCQQIFAVSRFCFRKQISSEDFLRQQICFCQQMSLHLSTKQRSRRHIHFHASLFREGNISPSAGAHFRCNHDCTRFAGPSR